MGRARERLDAPVPIECRARTTSQQAVYYESVAVPMEVPGAVHRSSVSTASKRAFTQWRLDFPLPADPHANEDHRSILAVVEKILLRGSLTICSPNAQGLIDEKLLSQVEPDYVSWGHSFEKVSQLGLNPFHFEQFDSHEEKVFYQEILPKLAPGAAIHAWTTPQLALSSLTKGSIPAEAKQRVDFYIAHPCGLQLVIEIDGIQHQGRQLVDTARDKAIRAAGHQVVRVPVVEIRSGNGPALDMIRKQLEFLPRQANLAGFEPLDLALLFARSSLQIQLAILSALKSGHLLLADGMQWRISINPPPWIANHLLWMDLIQEAVDDFIALVAAIHRLHKGKGLAIAAETGTDAVYDDPGIFRAGSQISIAFGGEHANWLAFTISDSYLPFRIAYTLPISPPISELTPDHDTLEYLLHFIFRKDEFRPGQWETIERSIQGEDTIVLLPTGAGKTIAFQLASLVLPGPCLVIDPLIALINDQLDNLHEIGVDRAVGLTSLLSAEERTAALNALASGNYLFIYVAPERLQMEDFRTALKALTAISPISLIAIDEAHCVSEWGHDFRTSYLNVARIARSYCEHNGHVPPLVGLTGTASRSVLKDLQRELGIESYEAIVTPRDFDRKELTFQAIHCRSAEKIGRLRGLLETLPQRFAVAREIFFQPRGKSTQSGLIFYPHVNGEFGMVDGYQALKGMIGAVGMYCGKSPKGIPDEVWEDAKGAFADSFKHNEITVLASTNAFGMGIDKPNIRYTIHYNLPGSIESFYQEAGRAGRDRNRSFCSIIISNDHPERTRLLLNPSTPLKQIAQIVETVSWGEADDITRMMWFHAAAFRGVPEELADVRALMSELGDLGAHRSAEIRYTRQTRTSREKAVHRLLSLGVVEDYTHDYANQVINILVSGASNETIIDRFVSYQRAYDARVAEVAETNTRPLAESDRTALIEELAKRLIEFVYNTIELSRRRSLAEMLLACTEGRSGEEIRARILAYLELGEFSELLEKARDGQVSMSTAIRQAIDRTSSPNDAAELRGQTARLLEAYPNNPSLLLIRTMAEMMSRDRDEGVVFDNFAACLSFAFSKTDWAMSIEEVADAAAPVIALARQRAPRLEADLVKVFLEKSEDRRLAARALIKVVEPEIGAHLTSMLLNILASKIAALYRNGEES